MQFATSIIPHLNPFEWIAAAGLGTASVAFAILFGGKTPPKRRVRRR